MKKATNTPFFSWKTLILITALCLTGTFPFLIQAASQTIHANPKLFFQLLKNTPANQRVLLDIRTPKEYQTARLKGAQLLNFRSFSFPRQLEQLDREKVYFIYCRTGNRSGQMSRLMEKQGFYHIINLRGGLVQWYHEGYPLIKP